MSSERSRDVKTESVAEIIANKHAGPIERLLVVGCGSGIEAATLARCLKAEVVGIDVVDHFDPESMNFATLQLGDAMELDFDKGSFDYVYSYHALEHIPNPGLALSEIHRVLKAGGGCWIGTPNRARVLGYLGSKGASLREKIDWNLADWKARLSGKFRNEMGAHAGFSHGELRNLLENEFSSVTDLSDVYFSKVYSSHQHLLRLLKTSRLSRIAYPSVYFMGTK